MIVGVLVVLLIICIILLLSFTDLRKLSGKGKPKHVKKRKTTKNKTQISSNAINEKPERPNKQEDNVDATPSV